MTEPSTTVSTQTQTKSSKRASPKWEVEAKERVRSHLKRFSRPLTELIQRDANEGDTRLLITDMLCELLGYDKYADLTTEYAVKGEFADYGIRIDQQLVAFVEVKRSTTKLTTKHLRQVEMYGVNEGVEWLILTNGSVWQVYRLIPGLPVTIDQVLDINLLSDEPPAKKAGQFYYLTKEAMKRGVIEEVWKARAATSPKALAKTLLTEPVIDAARKQIKRSTGHVVTDDELARLIRDSVIRPELTDC